jgi:hypothetical protein
MHTHTHTHTHTHNDFIHDVCNDGRCQRREDPA